jgi:Flp pilus assembly pilin Flp
MESRYRFLRDENGGVALNYGVVCGVIVLTCVLAIPGDGGRTVEFWAFVKSLL